MRKNIDLSDEAVKALSIQAIENGTNFKNYVEAKLEELSKEGENIKKLSQIPNRIGLLYDDKLNEALAIM
jgi:hypothetical protein